MRSSSGLCTPAPVAGLRSKLATQTTCKTPWTFFVDKEPHSSAPRQDMANVSERVVRRHPGLRHPAYIYRRRRIAALGILAFILRSEERRVGNGCDAEGPRAACLGTAERREDAS